MKKKMSLFSVLCIVILFLFSAFMIWYIPSMSSLQASLNETRQNLETSRGREGKQMDEYNKAVSDLPVVKAELENTAPLATEAEQTVSDLKARRKELREAKKKLEEQLAQSSDITKEGKTDEE
jgi:chromosome segregation ATPase